MRASEAAQQRLRPAAALCDAGATLVAGQSWPTAVIRELAGHADIRTTTTTPP